jgi:hypothetical protein
MDEGLAANLGYDDTTGVGTPALTTLPPAVARPDSASPRARLAGNPT